MEQLNKREQVAAMLLAGLMSCPFETKTKYHEMAKQTGDDLRSFLVGLSFEYTDEFLKQSKQHEKHK